MSIPIDLEEILEIDVSIGSSGSDSDITSLTPRWRRFVDITNDDIATMINSNVEFLVLWNKDPYANPKFSHLPFWVDVQDGEFIVQGLSSDWDTNENYYWTALKFDNEPT